jgi:predicted DNA-binding ribbon-helix-helix protein
VSAPAAYPRADDVRGGTGRDGPTIRKSMRVGAVRTSIKLEDEFWSYLKEVADDRGLRLSVLVDEVAAATPDRTNLASTLRVFALAHARRAARDPAPGTVGGERAPVGTAGP